MPRVHRRTFLGLPALGLALAACGGPTPVTRRQQGTRQVHYGDDPSQYAELTLPNGTPRGVVVVIHGGFWKAQYGIEYARPLVPSLVEAGWATWAIEYRRVGPAGSGAGGGTPETFNDVARAIDTLQHQDLELSTVIALGHSAGGHLATWAAGREDPAVPITAVLSQAGVLDLVAAAEEHLGTDAAQALLGHEPGPADATWDPFQQIPLDVPVHCIHGDADTNVPISQSETYVRAAQEAGADAALTRVSGGDHFVLIDPASDAWHETLRLLERLG